MSEQSGKFKTKKVIRTLGVLVMLGIILTSAAVWSFSPRTDSEAPASASINALTYEMAMQSDKPFIIMFHTQWCGYCKRFMPKYKMLAELYKDKYNFILLDGDDTSRYYLIRDYAVGGFPTLYIVDPTIDNRILISNTLYDDIGRVQGELDRYLRIRAMIK